MARLPIPGSDENTWGDILNEYLSQTLGSDGTLKENSVGVEQLKPNSVGADQLIENSVTAAVIADGSITEAQLHADVQTKLNAVDPTLDGRLQTVEEATARLLAAPLGLTDQATIATNAALSTHFRVTVAADRTLGVPANPADGMNALWELTASGDNRVVMLTVGVAGGFELTGAVPSVEIAIPDSKTAVLFARYNAGRQRWTTLALTVTA
ncbi:hypothetical protein JNJ66_04630 [Candidatus Saccharibacteria bacterium]|nr:hypothetical protein [Candidatus Saccharibacteria bacterium]